MAECFLFSPSCSILQHSLNEKGKHCPIRGNVMLEMPRKQACFQGPSNSRCCDSALPKRVPACVTSSVAESRDWHHQPEDDVGAAPATNPWVIFATGW